MTIQNAIEKLQNISANRTEDKEVKGRLKYIIADLTRDSEAPCADDEINEAVAKLIENADSTYSTINMSWVRNLERFVLNMFWFRKCKDKLAKSKNKIDGETAQWVTTIFQGVIGVISVVLTILFALGIIPNVFGTLGEDRNSDALYYIIGTVAQQAVALLTAIIIGIINHVRMKRKYKNRDFTFEELMAVKYENKRAVRWVLSPSASILAQYAKSCGALSVGNYGKSKNGNVYNNAGDVIRYIDDCADSERQYVIKCLIKKCDENVNCLSGGNHGESKNGDVYNNAGDVYDYRVVDKEVLEALISFSHEEISRLRDELERRIKNN